MNMYPSSLKENLIVFFNECEELLAIYNLQGFRRYEVEYKVIRQKGLSWDYKPKIQWILVRNHVEEEVKKLESINPCVDNIIEINEKTGVLVGEENIEANRNSHKWELAYLFFEYKRLQENFALSSDDFVTLLINQLRSEYGYCKVTTQLIGFKTNLEEIKIGNFTIRKPTENELNGIINDQEKWNMFKISEPSDMASVSFQMDNQFWAFMEIKQNLRDGVHSKGLLSQKNKLDINNNSEIITNFKKLILALRLYNGNCVGIGSLFIKKSLADEGIDFEIWREYPFLDVKFGNFLSSSHFRSRSIVLESKEINSHDIEGINTLFSNLMLYDLNPLEQIDKALEHFFYSFEHNYSVYTFTELIMSLETVLLENVKANPDEKLNLIRRIREADDEKTGLQILKEYNEKNSIPKAIKMLNQILNPGRRNKQINKFFLDYENNGCYKIRNDLIHGNIDLNFVEIKKKIPDLEEYVRLALLNIIDLKIDNKLNCNKDNYFEKLKEALESNVRA